jgi:hypothetical protein
LRLSDVTVTADVDHVLARAAFAYKRGEIVDALAGACRSTSGRCCETFEID